MSKKLHQYYDSIKGHILGSSFIKSVLTLSSGVIISQILATITTPIISRIYDPKILGEFGLLTSNSSLISGIVTLGMITAIMLPKEEIESKRLCNLILLSIVSISTILLTISIAIEKYYRVIDTDINYPIACIIIYFFIILSQLSSIYYAYTNRLKKYKILFWNPIISSIANLTLAISLGLLGCGLPGYCIANLACIAINIIHMSRHVNPFSFDKESWLLGNMKKLIKSYQKFPKYQLPADIVSCFSNQMPMQLIPRLFGYDVLGNYSMAMRLFNIPISLLATPINRVFYRQAAEVKNNGNSVGEFSFKILKSVIILAILPIAFLTVFGKPLFVIFLGQSWAQTGVIATRIGLCCVLLFCSQCVSGGFVILNKQNLNFVFAPISFAVNSVPFVLAYYYDFSAIDAISLYALANSLYIVIMLGVFFVCGGLKASKYIFFIFKYIAIPMSICQLVSSFIKY